MWFDGSHMVVAICTICVIRLKWNVDLWWQTVNLHTFLGFSYALNIRPSESDQVEGKAESKAEAFDPREFLEPVRAYLPKI